LNEYYFSKTYSEAQRRFKDAAESVGAIISSYSIDADADEELTIDVAVTSVDDAPTLVISSGIHGVEGFLGSAVQHALLEQLMEGRAEHDMRYVLIHAVNPFGFSQNRRVNENNVDLNRNFLGNVSDYKGGPDGYASLNGFLNPESPPSRFEPFKLKAMWNICCYGMQSLKQSIAGGQYEYSRGLFFGGHGPCQSTQVIRENCDDWIGDANKIVHIDFHAGLGSYGAYKLLVAENEDSENLAWYHETFGVDFIEPLEASADTAYKISGLFGEWMQKHFASREYGFVGAEFGTYDIVRVLGALRAENRAFYFGDPKSSIYKSAKAELLECFCPSDTMWREQTIESSLRIIDQAIQALRCA